MGSNKINTDFPGVRTICLVLLFVPLELAVFLAVVGAGKVLVLGADGCFCGCLVVFVGCSDAPDVIGRDGGLAALAEDAHPFKEAGVGPNLWAKKTSIHFRSIWVYILNILYQ